MTRRVLLLETAWMYRRDGWIALFYLLVVTQGGHLLEHVAQLVQIHLLGRQGPTREAWSVPLTWSGCISVSTRGRANDCR